MMLQKGAKPGFGAGSVPQLSAGEQQPWRANVYRALYRK